MVFVIACCEGGREAGHKVMERASDELRFAWRLRGAQPYKRSHPIHDLKNAMPHGLDQSAESKHGKGIHKTGKPHKNKTAAWTLQ
jgi:hypothetical protein